MSRLQPPPRGFRLERCVSCALPLSLCICALDIALKSQVQLHLILPRTETRSTTNTARLLKLWLPEQTHIEVIGEHVQAPAPAPAPPVLPAPARMLFPTADALSLDELTPPAPGLPQSPATIATLVVPDGTWSQARRLARRAFIDYNVDPCALSQDWPSSYTLRRRSRGLCTFEAVAIAMAHNGEPMLARELLHRFHRWQHRAALLRTGLPPEACQSEPEMEHPSVSRLPQPVPLASD